VKRNDATSGGVDAFVVFGHWSRVSAAPARPPISRETGSSNALRHEERRRCPRESKRRKERLERRAIPSAKPNKLKKGFRPPAPRITRRQRSGG
jgi:hypothetical protein